MNKSNFIIFILASVLLSCGNNGNKQVPVVKNRIWYAQPASKWMEAIPVGNGRLGAMVFGDPNRERIQLNEDSMWPGGPDFGNSKGSVNDLNLIRELLKQGKTEEVDKLIVEKFSYKSIVKSHQTMGDLFIDFHADRKIANYTRSLNLNNALVSVKYSANGYNYSEEVFASAIDDVLMIELSTDDPQGLNLDLRLDRPLDHGHQTVQITNPVNNEISMLGMVTQFGGKKDSKPFPLDYGVKFETRLKIENTDGSVVAKDGKLTLKNVKKATMYLVCNTSFYQDNYLEKNNQSLIGLADKTFAMLKERHVKDYQNLFNRVSFNLAGKALDTLATDERLKRIKEGFDDPDLATKLFQFGRYLLISSSRPGTNPANLQGIWNEHIEAPWNADYHVNINLQMNYWPAEVTNLSECHEPLFDFTDKLITRGRITAKEQYGITRGAMVHHTTDLWAPTWMRAEQAYWGSWIHGGGWLAQHYWEHYRFTQDKDFLRATAYPAMKAFAEFYLDWLVLDERDNTWVSAPEASPENSYLAQNGKPAAISFGSAMGHQIIGEVFENVLAAAEVLAIEDDFIKEVQLKKENLHPGVVIGSDGRILEWNSPYEEPEKGHRHMSHLYALHPGDEIVESNKEAFEAAKKSIAYRLQYGGAGTGWSRAWMINLNARLFDKKSAEENIRKFMQISVADNMFDEHPPFQIDGNFGFTAGVAELLIQSHEGIIRILPALPQNWQTGEIMGLKARGNITVDINWQGGELLTATFQSAIDQTCNIVYKGNALEITFVKGKKYLVDKVLNIVHQ